MRCRLEKINHIKRQRRFYEISVTRSLFGEWCLCRVWGRLGSHGGREMMSYFDSHGDAELAFERFKGQKMRRGYGVIPVQLALFEWKGQV